MVTRRDFVRFSMAAGLAAIAGGQAKADNEETKRVRDRLWIWTHHPGVYDGMFGLPRNSRITPVDAAKHLGTPNIMFIRADDQPAYPFEDYAAAFKDVKNLQWSITGSGGDTSDEEREYVLQLAATMPNITGLYMDDFFNFARQCAQGLAWLREKRIADMIFCGAHLCDQGLEAVEWTRKWIAKVGDEPLEGRPA